MKKFNVFSGIVFQRLPKCIFTIILSCGFVFFLSTSSLGLTLGAGANDSGESSNTALGDSSYTTLENSTSIGLMSRATNEKSTATGAFSYANGEISTATGFGSNASGAGSTAT